ncbi:molybdopterin synthase subunit MoaD [Halopolyspora algeriensis]|uniref:Molybdopterin synthase subunit MoaD n=1 Tax=Halopolyspora algeriensis TaxID=1500506 RepID=A0A368VVF3_9ACTN|nr:ubiquitin-like small modifier protein 1 [Halopolyspora algeriensis]RCW44076.1 molybdopterin synthase subunit MoaD [Halopolyspora algeriensis]TQM53425.1 molybdopterin synthase subunit MoaD [Halopolyspora algeriensis]
MRITLLLPQMLRASADGAPRVEIEVSEGATLGGVLDELHARHPALERRLRDERRALRRYVNFYLDGRECRELDGAASRLADGAEVLVIPSVAGG